LLTKTSAVQGSHKNRALHSALLVLCVGVDVASKNALRLWNLTTEHGTSQPASGKAYWGEWV